MAAKRPPQWLVAEVATGLQALIALRLPGAPGADTSRATAEVWTRTIYSYPVNWTLELDAPRLRRAFTALCRDCDRWPAPRTLYDRLPARHQPPALAVPPISKAQQARNIARLKALAKSIQ